MVAFGIGLAFGYRESAGDRLELISAKKELADLWNAFGQKQSEVIQSKQLHQKRISIAYTVVQDYEAIFDDLERLRKQLTKTAVVLPFNKTSEQ